MPPTTPVDTVQPRKYLTGTLVSVGTPNEPDLLIGPRILIGCSEDQIRNVATLPMRDEVTVIRSSELRALRNAVGLKFERLESALHLIASPKRPDGTYNRDREACRILAEEALAPGTQHDPTAQDRFKWRIELVPANPADVGVEPCDFTGTAAEAGTKANQLADAAGFEVEHCVLNRRGPA